MDIFNRDLYAALKTATRQANKKWEFSNPVNYVPKMRRLPPEDSFHDIVNELLIVINFEYTNLINEKKKQDYLYPNMLYCYFSSR